MKVYYVLSIVAAAVISTTVGTNLVAAELCLYSTVLFVKEHLLNQ